MINDYNYEDDNDNVGDDDDAKNYIHKDVLRERRGEESHWK